MKKALFVVGVLLSFWALEPVHALPVVSAMPSYTQRISYGKVAMNESTTIWCRAWNLSTTGNVTYTISFGDGTANATGTATRESYDNTRSDYIAVTHTFANAGSKTVTFSVTDSTGTTLRQAVVRVLPSPAHSDRIDMAIEKALRKLYSTVTKPNATSWYWYSVSDNIGVGVTGFSTLVFEENGHSPFKDPVEDVYAYMLQKNHVALFSAAKFQTISNHNDGLAVRTSDTNGNGKGVYFMNHTYGDSIAAMALMNPLTGAAQAKTTYVPSGPLSLVAGVYDPSHSYSYFDFVTDFTDTLLWAQGDGSVRGGFEYPLMQTSGGRFDGSAQQWPSLTMQMANDVVGISTPSWWTTNAVYATEQLMNAQGGVDYSPGSNWFNAAKTGGALSILKGANLGPASTDGAKLLSFVQAVWDAEGNGNSNGAGWCTYWYGMYGVKKGLALQGITNITVNGVSRDWYKEVSGWLLGNSSLLPSTLGPSSRVASNMYGQASDGSWQGSYIDSWIPSAANVPASTAVGALTLTNTLTTPPPVAVIAAIPTQSTVGPFSVVLDATGSFSTDPTRQLVEYLWDFDSSDGVNWSAPDATGSRVTVSPAYLHNVGTHTVTLRVTDNSTPTPQVATATAVITVTTGDVAPVAVPVASNAFQGYNGLPGGSITLDGSQSYDVNGDAIGQYSWDLNGDGIFGDATGATVVFTSPTPYTGQVGLKVTANGLTSLPVYVDVQVSSTNLSLGTVVTSNLTAGVSADFAIPVTNDAASGLSFSNVTLQLYGGDPFNGGLPLSAASAATKVSLGVGETKTVTMTGVQLGGASVVYAYIDPLNTIPESSKADNVAYCTGKQPQTITFGGLATKFPGDADFNISATASSGLTVSFTSSNPAVATVTGTLVHIVGSGTTNITASQAGDATYQAAANVVQVFQVSRFTQVISFPTLPTLATSSADYDPGATSNDPGATVTYTSSNLSVATIVNGKIHPVGQGTSTITASANGDATYLAATPVQQTLTVVVNAINSVTVPSAGTYKESDVLTFSVTYQFPVVVSTAGGTPSLDFIEGSTLRHATYVSGSGTTTLTFTYTVVSADFDSDGIAIQSPLSLNGGSIQNQSGGSAPLSFTPPATPNVKLGGEIYLTGQVNNAPDTTTSAASVGLWDSIRSGMVMSTNGALAFRGHLALNAATGITVDNFQGIWKSPLGTSASTVLAAREGNTAPDSFNAVFDVLPNNPYINNSAQVTFVGFLRVNTGDSGNAVTTSNDTCLWSEMGGAGLHKVLREGESAAGGTVTSIAPDGWIGVSDTGLAVFAVKLTDGTSALVRATALVAPPGVFTLTTIAKQGAAAPAVGGGTSGTFGLLLGNSADPRMNPNGDLAFYSLLTAGGAGIWYQPAAGSLSCVARVGQTTPGLSDTFSGLDRPSLSSTSTMYFRAFLASGLQSVWKGNPTTPSGFTAIAKTNDVGLPGLAGGSKLWSLSAPFSNVNGKVAFRATVMSSTSVETRAIVTDTDGTLKIIANIGDVAPGTGGQTFTNFDNPVIGDGNQTVFAASCSGGLIGVFRQASNGGALSLVLKVGDTIVTGGVTETIAQIILPGGASDDRMSEVKTVDQIGRVMAHVTYLSGKTGILLSSP